MEFDEIVNNFKNVRKVNGQRYWEKFMIKYKCDRVCELGVLKGDHFNEMIRHKPKLAVAVDSWDNKGVHGPRDGSYSLEELDAQYRYFQDRVKDLPFVQIIKDYTTNAVAFFPDEYFDFVYIDADHSFDACYTDIANWYPKVKTGKFLVGHDYSRGFGVINAVNRFVEENKLSLMFLPPSVWGVVKK